MKRFILIELQDNGILSLDGVPTNPQTKVEIQGLDALSAINLIADIQVQLIANYTKAIAQAMGQTPGTVNALPNQQ